MKPQAKFPGFKPQSISIGLFEGVVHDLVPSLLIPARFVNDGHGETFGFELEAEYRPSESWTLNAWYSWIKADFEEDLPGSDDFESREGFIPRHTAHLRSQLDIAEDLGWSAGIWFVDERKGVGAEPYVRLDTSLRWQPKDGVELAIGGRNLLEEGHVEAESLLTVRNERIEREFWIELTLVY